MNIVDLPSNNMVIFHSYVNVYQRVVLQSCSEANLFLSTAHFNYYVDSIWGFYTNT